jgi:Tol biopolymer transport system component
VLALALATAAYFYLQRPAALLNARFAVSNLGFVIAQGSSTPTVSPDGRWLATPRGTNTTSGMHLLALNSVTEQILVNGATLYFPTWKPDSTEIAFFDIEGQLKKVRVSGGAAQNITAAPPPFGGGTWNRDGVILFSSQGIVYRVLEVGGERVAVTRLDASRQETEHLTPHFLPDGRRFLYLAVSSEPAKSAIFVGSLDSPDRTLLFESESKAVYAAPGYILFNRGGVVYAREFDPDKLALKGEPVRIADGVPLSTPVQVYSRGYLQTALFNVSETGVFVYRVGNPSAGRGNAPAPTSDGTPLSMVWFDRSRPPAPLGPAGTYAGVNLAPDGKRFAVHRHEGDGGDIWIYDPDQSGLQRWTFDVSQENSAPVWSPDGKQIAFASRRNAKWGIYVKAADLTGSEDRVVETDIPLAPMSWTQPGEIVYWVDDPKTRGNIWAVPLTGERKPSPVLQTPAQEIFPQLTADGKWIAYQAPDAKGQMQIWVNSYPKGQGSGWQITNEGGVRPRWRNDGKAMELYFYQGTAIWAVDIRVVGAGIQWSAPRQLFGTGNPNLLGSSHYSNEGSYFRYAVSADGQRFLVPQPSGSVAPGRGGPAIRGGIFADSLAAAIDSGTAMRGLPVGVPAGPNQIAVVLNWTRLLKPQ